MNKQEILEKLTTRKNELTELPNYVYNGDNSEFDKWEKRTEKTLEVIFGETSSELSNFGWIRFQPNGNFLEAPSPREYIHTHSEGRREANTYLESLIEQVDEFYKDKKEQEKNKELKSNPIDKSKVFIVHGHDDGLVAKVQLFLKKIGLESIVLHEQANLGKVILEKLEHYTNVGFAIVLYTPCDLGKAKADDELKARARQNVVFEHGYLIGKLGRENVAFIVDGKIETPGDMSGAVYSSASNHWQFDIVKELKAVGYDVSADNLF